MTAPSIVWELLEDGDHTLLIFVPQSEYLVEMDVVYCMHGWARAYKPSFLPTKNRTVMYTNWVLL